MFELRPLFSLIERQMGGGTPSRTDSLLWGGKIPWASVKDFSDDSLELLDTEEYITEAGLRASTSNLIPAGVPLVCTRMAVGRAAIASMSVAINQDVRALFPKREVHPGYLLRLIASLQARAEAQSIGSTVKGIRTADYLALEVPVAPSEEQPLIAHVLDTLDTQIRQTEALIAKLERIKQGLLTDLLTRGMDQNGQLRPTPDQAPHLYKDSPLGRIPREWSVRRLSELSLSGLMNGVFKEPIRVGEGVPLVNVADLYRSESVQLDSCEWFSATKAEIDRFGIEAGDIFFTRSSLKLEGIAQTSFMASDPGIAVFECHVMRLRPNQKQVAPRFLKEWCVGLHARRHFMAHAKQVTMTTISQDGIASLLCPVPTVEEQLEAVQRIERIDDRLRTERVSVGKLIREKNGLMDDLLTGRVRVTPLLGIPNSSEPRV